MSKIGFNTLAWSTSVGEEMFPIVDRLKNIGYDGIEYYYGSENKEDYRKFANHCKSLDLKLTGIITLGPDMDPIHPDGKIRENALNRLKWAIDLAEEMEAELIGGPFHSSNGTFRNKAPDAAEYQRSAEILHQAGEYAAEAGVLLTPEAINRFECYLVNTMDQMIHLLELVDHPNVQAHYDTHHANIEEKNISEAIHKIAPHLGHFHISENDRGTPGEGHIDFEGTFQALGEIGYDGWVTVEAFTRNDVGFANAIHVWREYNAPWDVAEKGFKYLKELADKYGL